jgi:hypothetical protein
MCFQNRLVLYRWRSNVFVILISCNYMITARDQSIVHCNFHIIFRHRVF